MTARKDLIAKWRSYKRDLAVIKDRLGTALALLERDDPALDTAAVHAEDAVALLNALRAREAEPTPTAGKTPDSDPRG